jgi:HD superfamily phosphohydrolase
VLEGGEPAIFAMSEKIIRDPVHDVIAFQMDRAVERLLFELLNTEEFQRLRRVRQLGLASLAYPGADHSRYSHSLGVMETARRMLDQLGRSHTIDSECRDVCLVAALLHDLGHGPFSQLFERNSGTDHEEQSRRILLDPQTQIHRLLREYDGQMPQRVAELMGHSRQGDFYGDILCSQLDADRFDYLLRDNLMTASRYGGFDLRWLLHALTIDEATGRLAVIAKGVSAVEAYLQSRFHMYRYVYFHKVVRGAEGMVKLALQRARRLAVQGRLAWPNAGDAVYKALIGQTLNVQEFNFLDDISIFQCFKVWSMAEDRMLAGLCRGLLNRRLFKSIDLMHLDRREAAAAVAAAWGAIEGAGGEAAYEMFYDEPGDTPYQIDSDGPGGSVGEILVCPPTGAAVPLASISPLPETLNRQLIFRRLHVGGQWVEAVAAAVETASVTSPDDIGLGGGLSEEGVG